MKPQSTATSTCTMFPEMVDVDAGDMAGEKDLRAGVAEARRVAGLQPGPAPAWPVEPGSLAEAVYWYRQLAGQGDRTRPEDISVALSNLGYAWRTDQRWAEAETAFREALQLYQQQNDRGSLRQSYFDLGGLFEDQERWSEAESAFAQSLTLAQELGDRRTAVDALGRLGVVCAALGRAEQAIGYLQQAITLAQELGNAAQVKRMRERLDRISQRYQSP